MTLSPYLNHAPRIAVNAFIHSSAEIIGDVQIGKDSSVWCNAVVRGDVNSISIGAFTNIQDQVVCHVTHKSTSKPYGSPLVVGDYVTIGHAAILHGCTIGNLCLIGMGSIVMDEVIIPEQVMIGAGSLIPEGKVLETGYLYLGRPAKKIRQLTLEEIKHLSYSAEHYVRVKNNYLKR